MENWHDSPEAICPEVGSISTGLEPHFHSKNASNVLLLLRKNRLVRVVLTGSVPKSMCMTDSSSGQSLVLWMKLSGYDGRNSDVILAAGHTFVLVGNP